MPRPPQLGTGENKPPARGSGPGPSEAPLATRHPRALGLPGGPTVRDPGPLQLHLSPLRPERPHPTPCHPARLQGPAPLGALSQGPSYPHKKTRNATGDGPGPAGHHLQQPRGDQSVRLIFPSCIPSSLPEETFSTWGSHSGVLVGGPARLVLPRFPRARPSEPLLGPRPRSIGRLAIWATRCVESSCADGHFCVCVACAHREESSESFKRREIYFLAQRPFQRWREWHRPDRAQSVRLSPRSRQTHAGTRSTNPGDGGGGGLPWRHASSGTGIGSSVRTALRRRHPRATGPSGTRPSAGSEAEGRRAGRGEDPCARRVERPSRQPGTRPGSVEGQAGASRRRPARAVPLALAGSGSRHGHST